MSHHSVPKASEKLQMSQSWLRQQIYQKKIRYLKIGRRVFIPQSTIDEILSQSIREPVSKKNN